MEEEEPRERASFSRLNLPRLAVNPAIPTFAGSVRFTEDGSMIVSMDKALLNVLDVDGWFFARKNTGKTRVPIEKWKRLRVQSVFTAFAYHLAHADELQWYWDNSSWHLQMHLADALLDIGLKAPQIKYVLEVVTATVNSLYPWAWGHKLASTVGEKVLEELEKRHPEIHVRRATRADDDRSSMLNLCIGGVSVIAEWSDERGHHKICYSFVD